MFVKFNDNTQRDILEIEAEMLRFLEEKGVRVPRLIHVSRECLVQQFLKLDTSNAHIPQLAEVIGKLHANNPSDKSGFHRDNFHGPLTVSNAWHDDWPTFFRKTRYMPLIELLAARGLHDTIELATEVLNSIHIFFPTKPYVCLLHGDFHLNNWGVNKDDGQVYMFDPLPLYGHNEFELASFECYVKPKEAFREVYERFVPRTNASSTGDLEVVAVEHRRWLYFSFFRLIGFILSDERENLDRAHHYLSDLLLVVEAANITI